MKLQLKTKSVISYLPKKELAKQFSLADFLSVSQVLSDPKKDAFFKQQMKNSQSAMAKAVKQGTRTHRALETGTAKDEFTAACLKTFQQSISIDLDEVWGQEEWLAYPAGFKGKFDGIGIFRGKLTLFDHKKTNKQKVKSALKGYFSQLSAYKIAHEFLYPEHLIEQVAVFNIFGTEKDNLGANATIMPAEEIKVFSDQFVDRCISKILAKGA